MKPIPLVVLALGLILGGDVLAWVIQTDGGAVDVRDVRWTGSDGARMSGLLYVPDSATPTDPAPGILAVHGYINSRETQDGFAIEFARRGAVVLALDQSGHGYSDPPAFRGGFGGAEGLAYLRSLDVVDTDNIGLEGHSMGGWAVLVAAAGAPDDYRSIVIQGSSTGTSGAPDATDDWPRNLSVVFSKYDEFSGFMWGEPIPGDVPRGEKLMAAFGTTEPVVPGRVYGSIAEGTARVFHQPPVTHPADHFSRTAIGHAVDWFQQTLTGMAPLPHSNQRWFWKEFGNLLGAIGMILLLFPTGTLLLRSAWFRDIAGTPEPTAGARGAAWWGAAVAFMALPALTLFPFKTIGGRVSASAWFPQAITSQIMVWAVLVGAISAVLFGIWHATSGRKTGGSLETYGLTSSGRVSLRLIGKSLVLAILILIPAYAALTLSAAVFTVDFRFWVFAIKPMGALHGRIALSYVLPFIAFCLVYATVLFGQLRRDASTTTEMLTSVVLSAGGFVALIVVQYTPLFLGGTLMIPAESLWSIIAFQFVPMMSIVALVNVHFQRATGRVYVGAFVSGMLVTWIVVASQATHYSG